MPPMRYRCCLLLAALVGAGCSATASPPGAAREDIHLESDSEMIPARVSHGETLGTVLRRHSLHPQDVDGLMSAIRSVFDPRHLRVNQTYRLERTTEGCVRLFEYEVDLERLLQVVVRPDAPHVFEAEIVTYDSTTLRQVVTAAISEETPSLFEAMGRAGQEPELTIALAEIFGGEVDFRVDLQRGDEFTVLVHRTERDGRFVRYGDVAAASVGTGGRRLRAVRYAPPGLRADYYDEQGRSLKRFFLRSPLRFEPRVTSGFSRARLHPVLHVMRAHLGVDYRAPTGAPVVSVANGVVSGAGWRGGGGRTVSIRHGNGYETFYLHLSSIAPGVRKGARVTQGQLIGRVGSTGLATGPHLDYRLRRNGVFVNPLTEHRRLPPGEPVPAAAMAEFAAVRDAALQAMNRE
jgi:murein DD-endopeptidase MepM/ murein hydrolase activator NlpD